MKSSFLLAIAFFGSVAMGSAQDKKEAPAHEHWQDGDIVFIKNTKMAASANDKSKFNCAGVIFHEKGQTVVYYASQPLKKCTLDEFIAMSEDKKYSVKWLMDSSLLNEDVIKTMHTYATAKLGSPYDTKEDLSTEDFYNAEFIWKIYRSSLGIHLCEPKEVTASNGGKEISSNSLANKYVTIRDLYRSELLE